MLRKEEIENQRKPMEIVMLNRFLVGGFTTLLFIPVTRRVKGYTKFSRMPATGTRKFIYYLSGSLAESF